MKTHEEEIHYLELHIEESQVKQVNSECQTTLICDVWNQNTVCTMLLSAVRNSK